MSDSDILVRQWARALAEETDAIRDELSKSLYHTQYTYSVDSNTIWQVHKLGLLDTIITSLEEAELVAVDTETTGVNWSDTVFCIGLAWQTPGRDTIHTVCIKGPDYDAIESGLTPKELTIHQKFLEQLPAVLADKALVFHNAKFDLEKLKGKHDIDLYTKAARIEDTYFIAKLMGYPAGLKELATYLNYTTPCYDELVKYRKGHKQGKSVGYHMVPWSIIDKYVQEDARLTLSIFNKLLTRPVAATNTQFTDIMDVYEVELGVLRALMDMELHGLSVDVDDVRATRDVYSDRIKEIKDKYPDLNLNSHQQIKDYMHTRYNQLLLNTQFDYLTQVESVMNDPIARSFIRDLIEYKKKSKLVSTYMMNILREQDDGIIHPWISQFGASTGRTSSRTADKG